MITFAVEEWEDTLPELKPFFPIHYKELALNQDVIPLDPQWDVYSDRNANGQLMLVVGREDGYVIGYFIGFVLPSLHYKTSLTLTMDIFYIDKDKRKGRCGIRLFQAVEKEARRRGVQRMLVGSKMHKDASALFKYLKYEPIETYFSKMLGE